MPEQGCGIKSLCFGEPLQAGGRQEGASAGDGARRCCSWAPWAGLPSAQETSWVGRMRLPWSCRPGWREAGWVQAGAAMELLYLYVQLFFVCRGYFKLLGWLGTGPTLALSSLFEGGDFFLSLFLCCINASHFTGLERVCTAEVS